MTVEEKVKNGYYKDIEPEDEEVAKRVESKLKKIIKEKKKKERK